jgi:hypothetical protein
MEVPVPSAAVTVCRRATAFDASPRQARRFVPYMHVGRHIDAARAADFDCAWRACGVGGDLDRARTGDGAGARRAAFTWAARRSSPSISASTPRKRSRTATTQADLGGNKLLGLSAQLLSDSSAGKGRRPN